MRRGRPGGAQAAGLTFEQAAAVPMAGQTALRAIRDVGRVQAGHRVLINGAAGGVGTFAVQIAAALGAKVTGVCSTRNVDLVRSIGAAHVIDYTEEDFTDGRDALRRDPRQRRQPAAAPAAPSADPDGHPRVQRRRLTEGTCSARSAESSTWCSSTGSSGGGSASCRTSGTREPPARRHRARRGRDAHPGPRPDVPARPTPPRACATSRRDTPAARSSSPWRSRHRGVGRVRLRAPRPPHVGPS